MTRRSTAERASHTIARLEAEANIWLATLDSADDVAIFDVTIGVIDYGTADASLTDAYTSRVGWDPGAEDGDWSLLILTITRGQAWNGPGEIAGRTIIRDGAWLT